MSQMRSTEAHGSVREKAHMNHSVMYRMGSRLCFLRWRWAVGDTLCSRAYRISPSSWMASWGDGEQQSEQTPVSSFKPLRPSFKPSQRLEWLRHLHHLLLHVPADRTNRKTYPKPAVLWAFLQRSTWISSITAAWLSHQVERGFSWAMIDTVCLLRLHRSLPALCCSNPAGTSHRSGREPRRHPWSQKGNKCNKWTNIGRVATHPSWVHTLSRDTLQIWALKLW